MDAYWSEAADLKSTQLITNVLEWEKPDFVVFTGDQVSGDQMYANGTENIHVLLKPLVEKRIRWGSVYGNHDIGPYITRLGILEAEQSYGDLCYTKLVRGDLPGVTNYYIPVYANSSSVDPAMIWWFFDSQGGSQGFPQPNYIGPSVIQWFKNESIKLNSRANATLPSLVFFHIPPYEFVKIHDTVLTNPLCNGLLDDDVTPQENTGIMEALMEVGGVKTVFVGHDHGNAWCCYYKTIQVCYNRPSGYSGYGTWLRGARIIHLDVNDLHNQINYVRLENGQIVDSFTD
ncbi:unnamed protein product [Orchesella dallaii]|uniref:Calcineurin-like phosphoesterase domain-containing protein n=1 Tax=Orchesella dallaii TaxID=48710 RepID=A0ABP1PRA4_9HEXA